MIVLSLYVNISYNLYPAFYVTVSDPSHSNKAQQIIKKNKNKKQSIAPFL